MKKLSISTTKFLATCAPSSHKILKTKINVGVWLWFFQIFGWDVAHLKVVHCQFVNSLVSPIGFLLSDSIIFNVVNFDDWKKCISNFQMIDLTYPL